MFFHEKISFILTKDFHDSTISESPLNVFSFGALHYLRKILRYKKDLKLAIMTSYSGFSSTYNIKLFALDTSDIILILTIFTQKIFNFEPSASCT